MNFGGKPCDEHTDEMIMGICMAPECNQKTRLMCFGCSTGEHFEHAKYVVKVNDLSKDIMDIKNFPQDDLAIEMKKMITQNIALSESGLELIDKIFEEHTKALLDELERAKEETKKKLEKSIENKNLFEAEKLKTILFQAYDLTNIQLAYSRLLSEEISSVDFNVVIDEYVKATQSEATQTLLGKALDDEAEKAAQSQLDTESLSEIIKDLCKKIKEIPESIISEGGGTGSFKIEPAPSYLKNPSAVEVKKPGKEITLKTSYSVLLTSILDKGRYEFEIETVNNINSCCLFGLVPEEQKENTQSVYSSHPYHCFSNSCGSMHSGGNCESEYQTGAIMVVIVDFRKDQYSYGWKHSQNRSTMTGYTIKGKKMRWYINAYSVSNVSFKLLKAKKN